MKKLACLTLALALLFTSFTFTTYAKNYDSASTIETMATYPTLQRGDTGPYVKILQRQLNKAFDPDIAVDGIFGPDTERYVKMFQAYKELDIDGIVGPKTWEQLLKY